MSPSSRGPPAFKCLPYQDIDTAIRKNRPGWHLNQRKAVKPFRTHECLTHDTQEEIL